MRTQETLLRNVLCHLGQAGEGIETNAPSWIGSIIREANLRLFKTALDEGYMFYRASGTHARFACPIYRTNV